MEKKNNINVSRTSCTSELSVHCVLTDKAKQQKYSIFSHSLLRTTAFLLGDKTFSHIFLLLNKLFKIIQILKSIDKTNSLEWEPF